MTDLMASPLDGQKALIASGSARLTAFVKRLEDLEIRLTTATAPSLQSVIHLKIELPGGGAAHFEATVSYSVAFGDEFGVVADLQALYGPNDEKALRTLADRLFPGRDLGPQAFSDQGARGRLGLTETAPKTFSVDLLDDARGSVIAPPPTPEIVTSEAPASTRNRELSSARKVMEGTLPVQLPVTVSLESSLRRAIIYRTSQDGQRLLACVEGRAPLFGARADVTSDGDGGAEPTLLFGAITWVGPHRPDGTPCAIRISRRTEAADLERWTMMLAAAAAGAPDDGEGDPSPPTEVWSALLALTRSRAAPG